MSLKITDLKLFSSIQDAVNAIPEGELDKLKPGDEIPPNATVLGEMPPALKALLWLRDKATNLAYQTRDGYVAKASEMTGAQIKKANEELKKLDDEAKSRGNLFWAALAAEFPQANTADCGYGPHFEVYTYECTDGPTLGDLLGSLIGSLGKTRPQN